MAARHQISYIAVAAILCTSVLKDSALSKLTARHQAQAGGFTVLFPTGNSKLRIFDTRYISEKTNSACRR